MIDLMEINLLLLNPGYLILESIRHHHMTAWGCSLYAGSIITKKNSIMFLWRIIDTKNTNNSRVGVNAFGLRCE